MADIKTRDAVKGTIKTIDKAAVAGQRMKQAYISTKDKAEHSTSAAENSACLLYTSDFSVNFYFHFCSFPGGELL